MTVKRFFTYGVSPSPSPDSGGSVSTNASISVADINDPSPELSIYNSTRFGVLLLAYSSDGENYTLYSWTDASLVADPPDIVAGKTGFWVAIGGTLFIGGGTGSRAFSFFGD